MPASIGVNLRVTGHCRQGGRKYMEDFFSVAYQQTEDEKDLEYAFFGIYDGHGGGEAATFAKEHLMESIVRQKNFWSEKDEDVLKAIKDGYIATHYAMWKEQEKWPKTASGLPSTAGTTASVAFIRRGKIYIGHVGDSGIILGYQDPNNSIWQARPLTKDHKPENESEMNRIEQCGGKVITKSGVPRVVWNRPRIGHKGPVRRSTQIDEIPFLAVARSLGDLWSYNSALDEFIVSPDPDTCCISIDCSTFRCLIFGTDGLWNMIGASTAVNIVQVAEQHNERTVLAGNDSENKQNKSWVNPSKCLVERALERWSNTRMRADNTSVITLMLDPPGPPRAVVIKNQKLLQEKAKLEDMSKPYPENGLEIVTMYEEADQKWQEPVKPGSELPEIIDQENEEKSIQINEISSSSNLEKDQEENNCVRCTRSHDMKQGFAPLQKIPRSNSESPKRKIRIKKSIPTTKREHSDSDISRGEALRSRLSPGSSSEPPQKLRRSRSLGPRDFTLRSAVDLKNGKKGIHGSQTKNPLLNSLKKISTTNRCFTPVRQAMQTRNRVKRLNNK